ncbi:uncharacterized protein SPSK_06803 [Sporothrix schenckii 1099-18]|uniref:Uncharacterized protein n=1 Tax=Sporothrix schenckii 1099-18 TaxID=1397361 RepID=A0A0F2MMF5_SPOSC|nr:uncharacterized protein SPSK_06803 [Sporothrix schenckii 1099-18]KJR89366.1 hypothetical protein SPSK_06803 [Sporothrix schenckii 1099-18]
MTPCAPPIQLNQATLPTLHGILNPESSPYLEVTKRKPLAIASHDRSFRRRRRSSRPTSEVVRLLPQLPSSRNHDIELPSTN